MIIIIIIIIMLMMITGPPGRAQGFSQPLTEMSTRSRKIMFLWSRAQPVCRAENLTAFCEPIVAASSTSLNPVGLHGLLRG
jgi:hypothetical protein